MEEEGEEEEDLWEDEQAGHHVGRQRGVNGQLTLRGHIAHLQINRLKIWKGILKNIGSSIQT